MNVGDLVQVTRSDYVLSSPVAQTECIGIIIGFAGDLDAAGQVIMQGSHPIVYWNSEFYAEVEFSSQIKVINI